MKTRRGAEAGRQNERQWLKNTCRLTFFFLNSIVLLFFYFLVSKIFSPEKKWKIGKRARKLIKLYCVGN